MSESTHFEVVSVREAREKLQPWLDEGYVQFNRAGKYAGPLGNLARHAGMSLEECIVTVPKSGVVGHYVTGTPIYCDKQILPGWMVDLATRCTRADSGVEYDRFLEAFNAGLRGDTESLNAFLCILELATEYKNGR